MTNTATNDQQKKRLVQNPLERLKQGASQRRYQDTSYPQEQYQFTQGELDRLEQDRTNEWFRKHRTEFTVFRRIDHQEDQQIPQQIQELLAQIRREIERMKQSNQSFVAEIEEIEKTTIETLPHKAGVYHVRFLEVVLSFIQTLKSKVGEAHTWLEALKTKKKKRGSLFARLSKKKGTQYSLSQELQSARNVM